MKHIIYLTLLLLPFFCQAQRIDIPNTKYSIVPPPNFTLSQKFSGFQNTEIGASIMVNELAAPYEEVAKGLTTEQLGTRGMVMKNKENIELNGLQAILLTVSQVANGNTYTKYILAFQDGTATVLVNGIFPEASEEISAILKASVLSIKQRSTQNSNPLDAVKFSIDISNTEFKFVKLLSGTLLYTSDGNIPSKGAILTVGNSFSDVEIKNKEEFVIKRLKALPNGKSLIIKETNHITIDQMQGTEVIAYNANSTALTYMVMLFNKEGYYMIVGITEKESSNYLNIYKSIAQTFKRKP